MINNSNNDKLKFMMFYTIIRVVVVLMIISCGISIHYIYTTLDEVENRISSIETQMKQKEQVEGELLALLKKVDKTQKEIKQYQEERKIREMRHQKALEHARVMVLSANTDLMSMPNLSIEDMDRIIDEWDSQISGGSRFSGHCEAFLRASLETRLNPIMLFSIASLESGFGNSQIAEDKNNFYGIGAYDSSPYESSNYMGDDISEGIISGAHWIKENYYDNGYTTLNDMSEGGYSTSGTWSSKIINIAVESQDYL